MRGRRSCDVGESLIQFRAGEVIEIVAQGLEPDAQQHFAGMLSGITRIEECSQRPLVDPAVDLLLAHPCATRL